MRADWLQKAAASPYAWSAWGGLALAAAFPKVGWAGLAWVGPGWILFSALGAGPGVTFRVGYVAGMVYALAAFYWLLWIPFPAGAVAGWLALSAYLALYAAVWVWLCGKIFPRSEMGAGWEGTQGVSLGNPEGHLRWERAPGFLASRPGLEGFLSTPVVHRVVWAFGCAMIWVALEMILARLFTGFPWNLLGVSQYRILPLIQIASWTGVYGVTFILVWFSAALACAALRLLSDPTRPKGWVEDLIIPLLALLGVLAYGSSEVSRLVPVQRTLPAVLIQPSVPQTLIWDTNRNAARFEELIALSERALRKATNAQLLVWPEAAVPNLLRYEIHTYRAVTNLTGSHGVWMILGSDDAAPRPGTAPREFDFFNGSFLVSPGGEIAGSYYKRRLVIFGEYIPLERWVPFMKYLTPVGGSFATGQEPVPFRIPELQAKTSVLICFEDIFPHHGREYVEADTDFLLNLTNNGWFGESAAQWQHAANAVFRAVENRIPLVRCANNGLTCWVDARGVLHDVFRSAEHGVYGPGFQTVNIPLLAHGERRALTFYTRHGDWFGWACVVGSVLHVGWMSIRRRR